MSYMCKAAVQSVVEERGNPVRPDAYRERGHASLHSQSLAESYIILGSVTLQQRPARERGMHEPARDFHMLSLATLQWGSFQNSCTD